MRTALNDLVRLMIGACICVAGALLQLNHSHRVRSFQHHQQKLRRKYGIDDATTISSYGPQMEEALAGAGPGQHDGLRFAYTSGSTGAPKRVPYSRRRIAFTRWVFIDFYVRCCWAFGIGRKSLYVFHSRSKMEGPELRASLTSLLLEEARTPSFAAALQAPYRMESLPQIQTLAAQYGWPAIRLWILALSNPGVLYSTNPSTLCNFFEECTSRWHQVSALIRDFYHSPLKFESQILNIARRIRSRGWEQRIQQIASSNTPLTFMEICPAACYYICWDGGYVGPFLRRLQKYLPPERFVHIPMYSMSTESIETVPHFSEGEEVRFLPMAPNVFYEFLPVESADVAANLLRPDQLERGSLYAMVISDPYGLRRYQTDDLFMCDGFIGTVPSLRFVRRRGITYSFTGEKVTSEQISTVLESVANFEPRLRENSFLTCMPAELPAPHYKIVVVSRNGLLPQLPYKPIANHAEELLAQLNDEYRMKRESGRLAELDIVFATLEEFANRLRQTPADHLDSQFKFLPFYPQCWDALMLQ